MNASLTTGAPLKCTRTVHYARVLLIAGIAAWATSASAQVLAITSSQNSGAIASDDRRDGAGAAPENVPAALRRQVVNYTTSEATGTVIIDTANTYLYFVLGGGRAIRYGIGVGRDGFTWSGTKAIERKTEWPDWLPPAEMLERQPYLPRFMAGGPGNPLGARAMYLGGTLYRIHGTNSPSSIGKHVSSGCIRMLNGDVIDLYERTHVGTKVVVLPGAHRATAHALKPRAPLAPMREASLAQSLH